MRTHLKIQFIASIILWLSIPGKTHAQYPYVDYWFTTLETGVSHAKAIGSFAATDLNTNSGFANSGRLGHFRMTAQKTGPWWNYGAAIGVDWGGIDLHDQPLRAALDEIFAQPEARGNEYAQTRGARWNLVTLTAGPVASIYKGPITLEGRLLAGWLITRTPRHTVAGNYRPPVMARFFYTRDNQAVTRPHWPNWVLNPEVNLRIAFHPLWGFKLNASMVLSKIRKEMEWFNLVPGEEGPTFVRTQHRIEQPMRLWTLGAGLYLKLFNSLDMNEAVRKVRSKKEAETGNIINRKYF